MGAGLIVSVLFSVCLAPLNPSDQSIAWFGEDCITAFTYIFYISVYSSLLIAFITILVSTRMYLHLTVWMCHIELQLWYLENISVVPVLILAISSVITLCVGLPFGIAVNVTPGASLIVAILVVIMLGTLAYWERKSVKHLVARMHSHAKDVLGRIMVIS